MYPFVLIVRLIILYVFLDKGYITNMTESDMEILSVLKSNLNSLRIDGIKYGDKIYHRQDNLSSEPRLRSIMEGIEEASKYYDFGHPSGSGVSFHGQIDEAKACIDDLKGLELKSSKDYFSTVPTSGRSGSSLAFVNLFVNSFNHCLNRKRNKVNRR